MNNLPIVKLRRIECFSAAHSLNNNNLSKEENLNLFGKCNTLHGHNYKIEVEVKGKIDKISGMVINITDLKKIINDVLIDLDHKNLNEIDYFLKNNIPTTAENISVFIHDQLDLKLQNLNKNLGLDVKLNSITLYETDKNIVKYKKL